MSKLKQPSVSDSFNAPSNKPDNLNVINWKQMLFQLLLVFIASATFGTIIHFSNKKLLGKVADKEDDYKKLMAAAYAAKIQSQLPPPSKEEIKAEQIISESKNVNSTDKV